MKKRVLNSGLVFSITFGLLLGFIPQNSEAQQLELGTGISGKAKCYHNVNTSTDGLADFCSNSVCVEKEGTGGGTFAKCG